MMGKPTVLTIGAGIGGLCSAARLAANGLKVKVLEKNSHAGGRCDQIIRDGHVFDTGPTLMLMPHIYAETFASLGERMEDYLELKRVDPTYRIHFDDGSSLDLTSNLNSMQSQLEQIEPGSFRAFLKYMCEGIKHNHLAVEGIAGQNFDSIFDYFRPSNLSKFIRLKATTKHYTNIGRYFKDPRLKAAFTFQDMYLGISPFDAPATYSLLQSTELTDGVWYPKGGLYRIIEALVEVAEKKGVEILYDTPVQQIDYNDNLVTGVTLKNGQHLIADIVIANADLTYVYRSLLPDRSQSAKIEKKVYTCSSFMFYWGVDRKYDELQCHNLFLAGDYKGSFKRVFKDLNLPDEPNFYIHAPERIDPSMAPDGQETLMALVPVGQMDDKAPQDWKAIMDQARKIIFSRLADIGVKDLQDHVKFELCLPPEDWKNRYNLSKGAGHGLSHIFTQIGYLRPQNRHKRYRNLYFVGASTHPGSGLPTVQMSANLTTDRITRDFNLA
jgi:phytoene desaturase